MGQQIDNCDCRNPIRTIKRVLPTTDIDPVPNDFRMSMSEQVDIFAFLQDAMQEAVSENVEASSKKKILKARKLPRYTPRSSDESVLHCFKPRRSRMNRGLAALFRASA